MYLKDGEFEEIQSEQSFIHVECKDGKISLSSAKGLQKKKQFTVYDYLNMLTTQKEKWLELYNFWRTEFETKPAGQKQHHYYSGGLEVHTAQVINLALTFKDLRKDLLCFVSDDDCIIGGFIHDLSKVKMYRYLLEEEKKAFDGQEFKYDNQLGVLDPEVWTIHQLMKFNIALTENQLNALMYAEGGFSTWTKQKNQPKWSHLGVLISCADVYSAMIINK